MSLLGETLKKASDFLSKKGIENSRSEAERLFAHGLACSRLDLHLRFDQPLKDQELSQLRELTVKRGQGVPTAYLIGQQYFLFSDFVCGPGVLIPRLDSEAMVLEALDRTSGEVGMKCADFGSGTGCLGLSFLLKRPLAHLDAFEVSPEAISYLNRNISQLGLEGRVVVQNCDLNELESLPNEYDLILANPPYIDPNDPDVHEEVRRYEPSQALFSEQGGLAETVRWLHLAKNSLRSGGLCFFEFGHTQGAKVFELFQNHFQNVELKEDLAGKNRYCVGKKL